MVIAGLGSSMKKHRANRKLQMGAVAAAVKMFNKDLRAARKSPAKCKIAGRSLYRIAWHAGSATAEMHGASKTARGKTYGKKARGAAVKVMRKALKSFDSACIKKAKRKAPKRK